MKKTILLSLVSAILALFYCVSASAVEANRLELQNLTIKPGDTEAVLPVLLVNEKNITNFQCDLYFPEGVEIAVDEYDDPMIDLARTTAKRHSVATQKLTTGATRIVCSSQTNAVFSGNNGAVLNITLKIDATLAKGNYEISIKNIVLSDPDAVRYTADDFTASLTVDVNVGVKSVPVLQRSTWVYDLNGRLVRANSDSLEGLTPGVYIMNRKKILVK